MIKYRLKFEFLKFNDAAIDRSVAINTVLSDTMLIESDTAIRKPLDGETISIEDEDYLVKSSKISFNFDIDNDITYYNIIIILESVSARKILNERESIRRKKDDEAAELAKQNILVGMYKQKGISEEGYRYRQDFNDFKWKSNQQSYRYYKNQKP